MGEHQQQVANKYQRMDFDELADAPLEALLSRANLKPVEGAATRQYRLALDAFDKQWCKRALPLFNNVKALDPTQPRWTGSSLLPRPRSARAATALPVRSWGCPLCCSSLQALGSWLPASWSRCQCSAGGRWHAAVPFPPCSCSSRLRSHHRFPAHHRPPRWKRGGLRSNTNSSTSSRCGRAAPLIQAAPPIQGAPSWVTMAHWR